MSEFKFACPVCGQHMVCDSSQGGLVMECPTCFQKIVAPQVSSSPDPKFIITGQKYVEKVVPVGSPQNAKARQTTGDGAGKLILVVIGGLLVLGGFYFGFPALMNKETIPVQNSGFETPSLAAFTYNAGGGSWSFSPKTGDNGSGIAVTGDDFTKGNPPAPEGRQVAFLQGNSVVSQSVPGFTPGKRYLITFAAAQRSNFPQKGQTWDVRVNGIVQQSFAPPQAAQDYTNYSTSFSATAVVNTIAFVGTDLAGGDNTIFIDNVQIKER